jgi:hypothetical protein
MESVQLFLNKFLPQGLAGDISFLILFVVTCLAIGIYFGRSQLVSFLIYGYIGVALLHAFPQKWLLFSPYARAIVFVGVYVFLVVVGNYLFDVHISNAGSDFFWRIVVMSFLTVGMVSSILLTLLPRGVVAHYLSESMYSYFAFPLAQVLWMVVPLFVLLFMNKRLR